MSDGTQPRIWALLGHRTGDNKQVLALAQGLGLPFETRFLHYNLLRKVDKRLLGAGLHSVEPDSRKWLQPPWPDLVIGVGHRSVPVARYIRAASGGRTKLVQLGNPRIEPKYFDLVITMPQYGLADSTQLLRLPFAMGSQKLGFAPTKAERALLRKLPRPHRLMVLGGNTKLWRIKLADIVAAAYRLVERSEADGGTMIVVGSQRTSPAIIDAIKQSFAGTRHFLAEGNMPRYATLLDDADEIHVTADSVSMLSEAVFTQKPVGMIPIRPTLRGWLWYLISDLGLIKPPPGNLRNIWSTLTERVLIGTLDVPVAGNAQDPIEQAVAMVRPLLSLERSQGAKIA